MRTGESMTFPDPSKTASRALLGRVLWIYLSDDTLSLHLVADHIEDHAARPDREPSIPCLRYMLTLTEIKILEYKNAILRSPFDQLLRSAVTEILGSARTLDSQPFEGSNNTPSILSLCLSLSKLSLKSLDRLRSALVLDSSIQSAYKKLISICIYCHNSISLIEIYANRMNALNIGEFSRVSNVANQFASEILDYDAIDLSSVTKFFPEGIRNHVLKVFPAIDCRNAQETIFCEAGISSPLSNKKESKRPMPIKRMIQVVSISPGGGISTSSKSDASAGELTRYDSFDITVDSAMQIKSFKRLAEVPSSLGYAIAYLSEAIESLYERFVILDNYLQSSLGKHQFEGTTMRINTLRISGGV